MSSTTPSISPNLLIEFLLDQYGLAVTEVIPLAGEVDLNFRIKTQDHQQYVGKIAAQDTDYNDLQLQLDILEHLAKKTLPFSVPRLVKNRRGESIVSFRSSNQDVYFRLQTWVSGQPLGNKVLRDSQILQHWGKTAAEINLALSDFDHPSARRHYPWNPSECLASRGNAAYITDKQQLEIAHYFWHYFEQEIHPKLGQLRKGVNHNDLHELNLMIRRQAYCPQISGLIDFGDALHCETINELAISCAYAGMHTEDPLAAFVEVTKGFHAVLPLNEMEIEVLFGLIAARLLISVATSAVNKKEQPENEYLTISEAPAWTLLEQMRQLSPKLAYYRLRDACGWEAVPFQKDFLNWVQLQSHQFTPVMEISEQKICQLDCSVGSRSLGNSSNYESVSGFAHTIQNMIAEQQATVGVGGYGEIRPFYTTDAFESRGNDGPRWRSVHLGYDIWTTAGVAVYAPIAGRIHSFKYDPAPGSYGATILLEHQIESFTFYTLYGHLSKDALLGLEVGNRIAKGAQIATLGAYEENGGWPPHLHFQVMLDILNWEGDFPGVAYPESASTWMSICPDPRWLMPLAMRLQIGAPGQGSSVSKQLKGREEQILNDRQTYLGRSLSISYQQPLHVVRGYLSHLFTTDGRRYLDTVNNVAHIGHEHPRVVQAGQRQMAILNTNTRYLHEQLTEYAKSLLATFPSELCVVHFVNSGSEANELALRMAKLYSGSREVLAMEMGYHGNTGQTIDISSYKFDRKGGDGGPATTQLIPIPDIYRGKYTDPTSAGEQYAAYVDQAIERLAQQGKQVGAFICESILSCGGQIELPAGFLDRAYKSVRRAGGLCISDEVQVGLGRIGSHWWGFELQGVVPDIVTLGKPLGNGHPIGAVVCTNEVAKSFNNGMEYFNTFGGNPVSCAIGQAVLNTVKKEGMMQNARRMEDLLKTGLMGLQNRYPVIGDIRGKGLFLGVELVEEPLTKVPATTLANYLKNQMRRLGILMSTDGPDENVLKIKPPLCFNAKQADQLLSSLETVFRSI